MTGGVSLAVAFSAGLLAFLSPCVLPLIPSYIFYITGISFAEATGAGTGSDIRKLTVISSVFFIAGFSFVFIILGVSASLLGKLLLKHMDAIRVIGGILVIYFGLYITGIFKSKALSSHIKLELPRKPAGIAGSFLVGCVFAAAWTPCVGPILGTILIVDGTEATALRGAALLASFSLGMGIPFFISSLLINSFLSYFEKIKKHIRLLNLVSGGMLIIIGILLLFDRFRYLSAFFL